MSEFFEFLFIPPWSPRHFIALGLQIGLGGLLGILEATGRFHLPFGKFRRGTARAWTARPGLVLINLLPVLVYVGGYVYFGAPRSPYHNLLLGAFILIFGIRALEAAFIRRSPGAHGIRAMLGAGIAWCAIAWLATKIHNDYISIYIVYDPPFRVLAWWGFGILLLGLVINIHHHLLLARLRASEAERYPLPRGGLFRYVVCPHYLGDILIWSGFAVMSRHIALYGVAFIVAAYLAGRAHRTLRWYRLQGNPPRRLKSLVPFIF